MAACVADPNAPPEAFLETEKRFISSENLLISCGCVPVDPVARKVAVIRDASTNVVELPKGRKNIHEPLLSASLRETAEETGLTVKPLPLKIATRATRSLEMVLHEPDKLNVDVTDDMLNSEPVAVTTYPCIYTGAFKMVFWFAASVNFGETPAEGTREPWEKDLSMEWVDAKEAPGIMTFDADGMVVAKVLDDMRKSGYNI